MSTTIIEPDTVSTPVESTEEHSTVEIDEEGFQRFTHVVFPKERLADAIVFGLEVQALCGYVWIPGRDPKKYPICKVCLEVVNERFGGMGKDIT